MKKYLELAIDQFYKMKEDHLDDDRHCVGAMSEEDYEFDGVKFKIRIDGFWEKSSFFDYVVIDNDGMELDRGDWD